MAERSINPEKITKPIQLLGAWLAGLILVNGSFLTAAVQLSKPEWASSVLVAAAVANVPIFLICIFLLQTKFRPEMQEDKYYARYLESRYSPEMAKTELVEVKAGPLSRPEAIAVVENVDATHEQRFSNVGGEVTRTTVHINQCLPHYDGLKSELEAAGIGHVYPFKSTSDGVPSAFIVTIVEGADIQLFQEIIPMAIKFGAEGVAHADKSVPDRRIFVGSYSYKVHPYVRISPDLVTKLQDPTLNWQQLNELLAGSPSTLVHPPKRHGRN